MSNQSLVRRALNLDNNVWVRKLVCGVLLLGLCFSSGTAKAQVLYGSLTGNVTDPSDAVVPGAQVQALNPATGLSRQTTTDSAGVYRFTELLPGIYKVTVSATSFGSFVAENVHIDVNTTRRVDVQLRMKQQVETVSVTSAAPLLQTDRADVHTNFHSKHIPHLPLPPPTAPNFQSPYP